MTNDHRPMTKVVLPRKRTEFWLCTDINSVLFLGRTTNDHRPMTKVVLPRKRTEFMSVQSQNSRMLQKILKYSPFKLPIYHNFMQTTSATKTYDLKIRT